MSEGNKRTLGAIIGREDSKEETILVMVVSD